MKINFSESMKVILARAHLGRYIITLTERAPKSGYPLPPITLHKDKTVEVTQGYFVTLPDGIQCYSVKETGEVSPFFLKYTDVENINDLDGRPLVTVSY
jgi:hypothetical protein